MTTQEIITNFELYLDDSTELSDQEELTLANKIYKKINNDRAWEYLKKEWSTTTDGTTSIALPSDFAYFTENTNYTENNMDRDFNSSPKGIYVGRTLYKLINWSDRRQYENNTNVAYVDVLNDTLNFLVAPSASLSISADYIHNPTALALTTSPIFPARFHEIIYHGMAAQDYIIQQSNKAESYSSENQGLYQSYLDDMSLWNAKAQLY